MTGLDIEAIRARFAKVEAIAEEESPSDYRLVAVHAHSAMDVPKLLEQLTRERAALGEALATVREQAAEIERLRAELLEEQTVHAKTFDNFEAHTEACLEERTRQMDRYARLDAEVGRLREWNDEIKAERDALSERCLDHEAEMREAGAEIRDAQAALADALQVIADLRGETP